MTRRAPEPTDGAGSLYAAKAARRLPEEEAVRMLVAGDPGGGLDGIGVRGGEEEVRKALERGVAIAVGEDVDGGEVMLRKEEEAPCGSVAGCKGASSGKPIGERLQGMASWQTVAKVFGGDSHGPRAQPTPQKR